MELALLLEDARNATPGHRIELRDPIAAHGAPAIEAVRPWLRDDRLAAFAVRVIEQAGILGESAVAARTLRAHRAQVPASVTGDVDRALKRLRSAQRPSTTETAIDAPVRAPRREPPRYDSVKARRPR